MVLDGPWELQTMHQDREGALAQVDLDIMGATSRKNVLP
jgi:hypothetical protein